MEILALRLLEEEFITPTPIPPRNSRIKVDLSDSNSTIPGEESDALAAVYGIVGPSIVTFGLIGNILILFVVGRSSMIGKFFLQFFPHLISMEMINIYFKKWIQK